MTSIWSLFVHKRQLTTEISKHPGAGQGLLIFHLNVWAQFSTTWIKFIQYNSATCELSEFGLSERQLKLQP